MSVLVTGGTGKLGSAIVKKLSLQKKQVSILSSREHPHFNDAAKFFKGNLVTGEGLKESVSNAEVIIHCASNPRDSENTDIKGTRNLLGAIDRNITKHFVYISIVGVDKTNYAYYKSKKKVEELISVSDVPYSILRTTQFHDLVYHMLVQFVNASKDGIIKIPEGMKFQSIDVNEVAMLLADIAGQKPGSLLPDKAGPEILSFEDMVQIYLEANNRRDKVVSSPLNGERYELFRSGINLCPKNTFGKISWKQFVCNQAG